MLDAGKRLKILLLLFSIGRERGRCLIGHFGHQVGTEYHIRPINEPAGQCYGRCLSWDQTLLRLNKERLVCFAAFDVWPRSAHGHAREPAREWTVTHSVGQPTLHSQNH